MNHSHIALTERSSPREPVCQCIRTVRSDSSFLMQENLRIHPLSLGSVRSLKRMLGSDHPADGGGAERSVMDQARHVQRDFLRRLLLAQVEPVLQYADVRRRHERDEAVAGHRQAGDLLLRNPIGELVEQFRSQQLLHTQNERRIPVGAEHRFAEGGVPVPIFEDRRDSRIGFVLLRRLFA